MYLSGRLAVPGNWLDPMEPEELPKSCALGKPKSLNAWRFTQWHWWSLDSSGFCFLTDCTTTLYLGLQCQFSQHNAHRYPHRKIRIKLWSFSLVTLLTLLCKIYVQHSTLSCSRDLYKSSPPYLIICCHSACRMLGFSCPSAKWCCRGWCFQLLSRDLCTHTACPRESYFLRKAVLNSSHTFLYCLVGIPL